MRATETAKISHDFQAFRAHERGNEKDRIDPVDPSVALALDQEALEAFPIGYRHLAYIQERIGYRVKRDMPGLKGPEVEALYARGRAFLQGGPAR